MSLDDLTYGEVLSAMRKVVDERPDYVYRDHYDTCRYVQTDDGQNLVPGCLVGQVWHRLGVPLDLMGSLRMNSLDSTTLLTDLTTGTRWLADLRNDEHIDVGFHSHDDRHRVEVLLSRAQTIQDSGGFTWKHALDEALAEVAATYPDSPIGG
jgi:hypothetical protein